MTQKMVAFFRRVADGYGRLLRSVGTSVLAAAGSVAVAALVVYPLWWIATHEKGVFNIACEVLFAALIIAWSVVSIVRRRKRGREMEAEERRRPRRGRIFIVAAFLVAIYGTAVLYVKAPLFAAIAATVVLVLSIGYSVGRVAVGRVAFGKGAVGAQPVQNGERRKRST